MMRYMNIYYALLSRKREILGKYWYGLSWRFCVLDLPRPFLGFDSRWFWRGFWGCVSWSSPPLCFDPVYSTCPPFVEHFIPHLGVFLTMRFFFSHNTHYGFLTDSSPTPHHPISSNLLPTTLLHKPQRPSWYTKATNSISQKPTTPQHCHLLPLHQFQPHHSIGYLLQTSSYRQCSSWSTGYLASFPQSNSGHHHLATLPHTVITLHHG